MSSVNAIRFSSSSLVNKTVTINSLSSNRLCCNLTYALATITKSIYGLYGTGSPVLPNLYTNVNVVALTGTTKGTYESYTTITFTVGLNDASSVTIGHMVGLGGDSIYVSSIQLYVAGVDLKFEFLNRFNQVLHTLQTTGHFTNADILKTIQIPNYDMVGVGQVRISSLVINSLSVNGLSDKLLLCNITYATPTQPKLTPLTLYNIPNPSSMDYFVTTLTLNATVNYFSYTQTGFMNYKPYYITIPSITLSGTGTFQLSFSLFSGLKTYVTTTFSISSSYPNGFTIPLQSTYTGTGIDTALTNTAGVTFTVTYPTTNAANAAPYLEANANITGVLTYIGPASTTRITTRGDLDSSSGWIVNLYGTDIIIDPILAPSKPSVKTPITYSSAKTVGFTAATTTAPNAAITYTIYPTPATPTTTMTTLTTAIASIPGTLNPNSFKLNATPESGNVTIYANSSEVTGYYPKSTYAQSTVKNYAATLPSGKVVPFANTYNIATGPTTYTAAFSAAMRINFTQNVILNALEFGYIFETFIKNGTNPNITNNGGYTATGATTIFTLNVGSDMPYRNYGSVQFIVTPNQTGNVYSALHTSSSNADGSNDGTLLSIPFAPTPATATATMSGGVITATITNGGSGYIYPPSVIVTGAPNTAIAYATISASGSVTGITFTSGNNGYGSAPTITFQVFNTATATAFVSSSGVITATITNGGSGYVYPPEVVISGVPNTATATATISAGSVTGITIASSGNAEYTTAPTIAIIVFRKATATAAVNNGVITATITNGGSGYVYPPQVVVTGEPNTATATATISASGSVTGITFISGNAGYSTAPTITFLYSSAASARSEPETMSSIAMATSPPSFPTYVSGFTTEINSPFAFAFNVGDEIIITLSTSNPGSVWTTPTTSTLGVQPGTYAFGEMCGALICTPNTVGNPTYNPESAVIQNAPPDTTDDVLSSFSSVSSPSFSSISGTIILTGFRFSGITISPSGSSLPAEQIGLRADIYRGSSVIFQVFFNYIESSSTAAVLYIPFSYAEYAKVGTANPTWVSRIVPTSMYFNQPQNPIFYTGEIFSIKLVNTSSNTSLVCTYRKNVVSGTTYAAGSLWGINENLPTITAPSPIITPIFYNGMNVTYVKIPKPVSTNTTSGFTYVASSAIGSFTTTDASNNCMLGINPSNYYLLATLTLKAYQSSSTTYSKSSVISYPNTVQMINTSGNVDNIGTTLYSNGKSSSIPPLGSYNSASSTLTFTQAIGSFNSDSRIAGFSFQYFGGFAVTSPTQFSLTVYVLPPAFSNPPVSRSMTFTVSESNTTIDKNGTMTFIPFNPTFYDTTTRPTNVTNITYDNPDMYTALANQIVPGAIIRVSIQVLSGTGSIAVEDGKLSGSLIMRKSNNDPLSSKDHSSTISMYNIPYSNDLLLFNDSLKSITSRNNLIITHIRVPGIIFQYPVGYPATIILTLSYRGVYDYTITCKLIRAINAFNTTSYLELTMPTPNMFGSYERRYDYGFYIEKINTARVGTTIHLTSGINFTTSDTSTYNATRYSYSGDLFGQTSYPIFNDEYNFIYNGAQTFGSNPSIQVTLTSPSNPIRPVEWDRPVNTNCALRVKEFSE